MKLLVIGASKGTGAEATINALKKGHAVSAFSRDPSKLLFEHERLTRVPGDFHRAESLASAVPGHDAIIITASASALKQFKENPNYFSQGTRYTIDAMKQSGVRRLVVLSALGTGESRKIAPWLVQKLLVGWILKVPYEDHERQERLVMDSGLDWVIARPGRLTNGAAHGRYLADAGLGPIPSSISRADTGDFLVRAATEGTWLGQAVQLGG